jgi:hypothetical protein
VPAFPGSARADDAATVEAKARFEEGLNLADAGKHEPARLKFQQAWAVFKSPTVLFNLARTEQLTGHELEALEHYRLFLRVGATDVKITDAMRDKAKQNAAELARKVGQIAIEVPASARVSVDGKPLDEAPRDPVAVQPGKHSVEATYDGRVKSVSVECPAGDVVKARIDFDAAGGSSTTEPPPVGGSHHGAGRWIVPAALGVAGLVGIGVGVGFGLKSQSAKTDAEDLRRQSPGLCAAPELASCASYDAKRSDATSAGTVSTVGYVAGGVLLAGAVTTFLLWPQSREATSSTARTGVRAEGLRPMIGAGTLGAGLEGRF